MSHSAASKASPSSSSSSLSTSATSIIRSSSSQSVTTASTSSRVFRSSSYSHPASRRFHHHPHFHTSGRSHHLAGHQQFYYYFSSPIGRRGGGGGGGQFHHQPFYRSSSSSSLYNKSRRCKSPKVGVSAGKGQTNKQPAKQQSPKAEAEVAKATPQLSLRPPVEKEIALESHDKKVKEEKQDGGDGDDEDAHICQLHTETLNQCLDTNGVYLCKAYSERCYIIQKVRRQSRTMRTNQRKHNVKSLELQSKGNRLTSPWHLNVSLTTCV